VNIYDVLQEDHETASELLASLLESAGQGEKQRASLFHELQIELELHTAAEEKVFYAALQSAEETAERIPEAIEEHREVLELLEELAVMAKNTTEWLEKLSDLQDAVEQHVDEEESELFPVAHEILSDEQAEELGERMVAEKDAMAGEVKRKLAAVAG